MTTRSRAVLLVGIVLVLLPQIASAQYGRSRPTGPDYPTGDAILKAMYEEGMDRSQVYSLAQTLADSIGPRLTGAPEHLAAVNWAVDRLRGWGASATPEQYGTWRAWQRGVSHVDLIAPRVRSLEGVMLGWSPGTGGVKEGGVVIFPDTQSPEAFRAWLPNARGKFVMLSAAEASCRPASSWAEHGQTGADADFNKARTDARNAWTARIDSTGLERQAIIDALEGAGATGFLTNYWTGLWGTDRIFPMTYAFRAMNRKAAAFDLSCEDYGLVYRLTEQGQGPRLRAVAESRDLGEQPVFNVVGRIEGSELPDEYVLLSAHYDSWDGASGMTDNGTGSVTMLEAMRILKTVAPQPKRTILIGLWGGEEQGLNGSRSFAADHPEIVDGLQIVLNQDNGTGRIASVSTQGLTGAGEYFARWFSQMPNILVGDIDLNVPGYPGGGGSDYASFICAGAPAFSLSATSYDYGNATWHTNRDTFDKIALTDLKGNATITAMLAYLAANDTRIARDRRDMGERDWPECQDGARKTTDRFR